MLISESAPSWTARLHELNQVVNKCSRLISEFTVYLKIPDTYDSGMFGVTHLYQLESLPSPGSTQSMNEFRKSGRHRRLQPGETSFLREVRCYVPVVVCTLSISAYC